MITQQAFRQALLRVIDPELGKSLVELGMFKEIQIIGAEVDAAIRAIAGERR